MRTRFALFLLAVGLYAADSPYAQQKPTFRSAADLVLVDAHVVARDGTPIEGLSRDQFEVFVDGRRRPAQIAEFVRASGNVRPADGGASAAAAPIPLGRVIVIAVDQPSFPPSARQSAIEAARRIVEGASADDHLGIIVFPDSAAVAPTRNREPVLEAIGRITGLRGDLLRPRFNISAAEASALRSRDGVRTKEILDRECEMIDPTCRQELIQEGGLIADELEYQAIRSITGLHGVLEAMEPLPGRKTLLLVSAGLPMSARPGGRPDPSSAIDAVARRAAAANVNLYVLYMNVHFLRAFSPEYGRRHNSIFDDITMFGYGLEKFADTGGGTFFQVEVDSDRFMERALRETSAWYVLGVEVRPEDRDGKEHFIRVNVKQRGAAVRYRRIVVIPSA